MFLAHGNEIGGAPIEDLIPATIVAIVVTVALALFARLHLSGRTRVLTRLADFSERVSGGLPGWAALPTAVAGGSLLVAVFGFYWDVATHIDNGRDPGPFANPSHYFIIVGLAGIALAGYLALLIGRDDDDATGLRIGARRVPLGGVMLAVCGVIALLGFPLDDTWHRIFGEDVTLWGPTHIQMIGGAALSTLAIWILLVEAKKARPEYVGKKLLDRFDETFAAGGFLVGLSALQAEFDYSMPQFRLLYQPVLLMLAAGVGLVAARIRLGKGGALKAVAVFLVIRGALSVGVGLGLDHTVPHFPLYIAEALLVELVALRVSSSKQLSFGVASGVAIGTIGLAAEWGWSHIWMTYPWPTSMMVEAGIVGLVAAIAAGILGALVGRALSDDKAPRQKAPRWLPAVTVVGILFAMFYPLPISTGRPARADVTLEAADKSPGRWVNVVVTPPPGFVGDHEWFDVSSWQGGGSVVAPLESAGDGTYHSAEPVPVYGEWKTLIRLAQGSSIVAVPVYMPRDPAIGAPGFAATPHFNRAFIKDKELLLREAKTTSPWLSYVAYTILTGIILVWFAVLGWGLWRLERGGPGGLDSRRGKRGRKQEGRRTDVAGVQRA
jgi:hypothetical protein